MSYPNTAIDKISCELSELATTYANKAEMLATDPYFREAVLKTSVSAFAWALYHAFPRERDVLDNELREQSAAISRSCRAVVR
jgi:hypothetical protein